MDVEASIADRLQKLKQWQIQQQEKLLKQQQIQREILSYEQDCIYKALGLSVHDFDVIKDAKNTDIISETGIKEIMCDKDLALDCCAKNSDNVLEIIDKRIPTNVNLSFNDCDKEESDDSDCASTIVEESKNSFKNYRSDILTQEVNDSLIEGIKPLSMNDISNRNASIDDIPLPSPKKNFQMLLEEKLQTEPEVMSNAQTNAKVKQKRPFLKKGQGLLRYNMSTNLHHSVVTARYNKPLCSNTRHSNKNNKSKKSAIHTPIIPKTRDVSAVNEKQQLNLKTVPLPKKKIVGKSSATSNQITQVTSNQSGYPLEINISDCDSKAEKELEEMRIFELLEEKAENSSFCSTSSTVLAFLQQSTPFKIKTKLNHIRKENDTAIKDQQINDQASNVIGKESGVKIKQAPHIENLKLNVQCQTEPYKCSYTNTTTADSYWNTSIKNVEEKSYLSTNQILQIDEAYTSYPKNHDISSAAVSLNSDEKGDTSLENDSNLSHDSETSHHVKFAECNEYRTIDLMDMSDTESNPSLKDYIKQQNWDDCSSESSDIKKKLPLECEEKIRNSSFKIITGKKTIEECNENDLYNCVMKTAHMPEENILRYRDESPDEDTCYDNNCEPIIEEIVQTSDEERFVLSSPLSSSSSSLSDAQKLTAHERKDYVLRNKSEKITEKIAKVYSNLTEDDNLYSSEEHANQISTFETELLKNRLLQLEKEIDIFRKESSALLLQRRKLQEEEAILCKQYSEKEKNFEENKKRVQNQLEEEKKRIAREKITMENRIRDAQEKARQSKIERQTAQNLREQLEQLKDELNIKESRWNATESRYKSELRVLRVENSKLKQEIVNLQNIKRTNIKNLKKTNGQVITKAINQINKRIVVAPSKDSLPKMSQDLLDTSTNNSIHNNDDENEEENDKLTKLTNVNNDFKQMEDNESDKIKYKQVEIESQLPKSNQKLLEENILEKKRFLYEDLLKDATTDFMEDQFYTKQDLLNDPQPVVTQVQRLNTKSNDRSYSSATNKDYARTAYAENNAKYFTSRPRKVNENSDEDDMEEKKREDRILSPKRNSNSTLDHSSLQRQSSKTNTNAVEQIQFADGHIEYWYPNNNVKKIFPDQEVTKMIYYNGDVREIDKNKKIKYFYAATKTWHTTTPDGLEILEFPDGQVEKRMPDGTIEVLFPDGTIAQTFNNGDKILTLPNGQKEIHTKAYKRREYPDGTIKLVYEDGTQETRYSNGRKRIKDKDGNLLMDSFDA
ncbi:hypothetical protein PUN28_012446 [Cardiocondyla obscurior]|uniref:Centromere protein J n=1 Tax=Cardiocondyla obscurior TaxID=286306 RepID=A0AAW2FEW8_9HYME